MMVHVHHHQLWLALVLLGVCLLSKASSANPHIQVEFGFVPIETIKLSKEVCPKLILSSSNITMDVLPISIKAPYYYYRESASFNQEQTEVRTYTPLLWSWVLENKSNRGSRNDGE